MEKNATYDYCEESFSILGIEGEVNRSGNMKMKMED